jgi:hypothetical protein
MHTDNTVKPRKPLTFSKRDPSHRQKRIGCPTCDPSIPHNKNTRTRKLTKTATKERWKETHEGDLNLSFNGSKSIIMHPNTAVNGTEAFCQSPGCLLIHQPQNTKPPTRIMSIHAATIQKKGRISAWRPHISSLPPACRSTWKCLRRLGIRERASFCGRGRQVLTW